MKKLILSIWGLLALGGVLPASEQTVSVTPQTLDGWVVTAADRSALSQATFLALPPGAQLSRHFDADRVAVQFKGQPVFGSTGEDFPTVESGPTALVFVRDGANGQLVLVMGDTTVIPLPFTVKLNVDGSSVEPVDVQLAYERTTGTVVVTGFGQTLQYSSAASSGPVEVVITSGAHDGLTLQNLAVILDTPDAATDDTKTAQGTPSTNNGTTHGTSSVKKPSVDQLVTTALRLTMTGDSAGQTSPSKDGRPILEVYTRPAVRHRTAAVRAMVNESLKK